MATTTPPKIVEQETANGKLVTISATDEQEAVQPMIDVPVRIAIPEIYKVGEEDKIKIKWQNNGSADMQFVAYDDDGNGFIDHVGWIVPHLSTQTFQIIYISNALQLDSNLNAIGDIFDLVGMLDQNFADLADGQYVRVTFDRGLESSNDITIYARPHVGSGPTSIQVYPVYTDALGNTTEGSPRGGAAGGGSLKAVANRNT